MTISISCPHCGTQTDVDDSYAGTSGPCRECGEAVSVPGSRFGDDPVPVPKAKVAIPAVGIIIAALGVGALLCGGILVALLLPAVGSARQAARRVSCVNNVKQIQLGILNYESANGRLPPAYTVDENGRPMHSWRVLILPYMEQKALYDRYDMTEPWDSPDNLALTEQNVPAFYQCPSSPDTGSHTNYIVPYGASAMFDANGKLLDDIAAADGLSRTLSVVETNRSDIHWSEPRDWDISKSTFAVNGGRNDISSHHPGGANVAMGDGSVQFFADGLDTIALEAMTTADAGD